MNTDTHDAYEKALAVKRAHQTELMRKANVVGVGVGLRYRGGARTGEIALVVMVRRKVPCGQLMPDDIIPDSIDGVPVDVQDVGELTAH